MASEFTIQSIEGKMSTGGRQLRRIVILGAVLALLIAAAKIWYICMPEDDGYAVSILRSRNAQFSRESRTPLLRTLLDSEGVFEYGPIWRVRFRGELDDEVFDALVSARKLTNLELPT